MLCLHVVHVAIHHPGPLLQVETSVSFRFEKQRVALGLPDQT